jgi:hypothetical protein
MRILRPVIQRFMPAMLNARHHLCLRCAVAAKFVCDDHSRDVLQFLHQLAEELLSCLLITPALHKNIEHITILINRTPKVMDLSINSDNSDEHLI